MVLSLPLYSFTATLMRLQVPTVHCLCCPTTDELAGLSHRSNYPCSFWCVGLDWACQRFDQPAIGDPLWIKPRHRSHPSVYLNMFQRDKWLAEKGWDRIIQSTWTFDEVGVGDSFTWLEVFWIFLCFLVDWWLHRFLGIEKSLSRCTHCKKIVTSIIILIQLSFFTRIGTASSLFWIGS